jgi:hypothetical protein
VLRMWHQWVRHHEGCELEGGGISLQEMRHEGIGMHCHGKRETLYAGMGRLPESKRIKEMLLLLLLQVKHSLLVSLRIVKVDIILHPAFPIKRGLSLPHPKERSDKKAWIFFDRFKRVRNPFLAFFGGYARDNARDK